MQAEPDQNEKTDVFMDFLKSISLRKAEIEYRDMIDYVDKVLKPHIDDWPRLALLLQGVDFFRPYAVYLTLTIKIPVYTFLTNNKNTGVKYYHQDETTSHSAFAEEVNRLSE